jgi:predicted ATPase/DNA-binding winged helix-turn-helix (wHTH) protein
VTERSLTSIEFGPFRLAPHERLLTREGKPLEIGGRALELLIALVEQPGRVLSKTDLLRRVWPDVAVEDGSLRFHMAGLRKVLGDGEDGARYISTQVGVGYAFVAPLRRSSTTPMAPEPPPGVLRAAHCAQLPARLPHVFGRAQDISLLSERMTDTQLFTIVGAGGVGKTTLAVELGYTLSARFEGAVSFVDLGALQDPELIASAIAGVLGIQVQADDALRVVLAHIKAQKLLLILDNCEHLIDAVAILVERIGEAAPQVRILATCREPLRVRAEHVHWLGSLDYPGESTELPREQLLAFPALQLFVERARASNSALALDDASVRSIAELCRRLDGMALPIELTAVRVASHGLAATAKLLGERFSLAWTGRRTALPRQQTLRATFDWSYELLSEFERRTFERLSVFRGPFTVDAALEVVSDEALATQAAASALDELTAKSLVAPDRAGSSGSYRLLEMTRAYGREKLGARGGRELNAVAKRHASYYLAALEAGEGATLGNLRSALAWSFGRDGDLSLAVRLAAACAPVFLNQSLLVECRSWCARALGELEERHRGSATELELQSSLGLSLMFTRGNSAAVEAALRRALEVAVALADRWHELRVLGRLHIFHERCGDFETALAWAERALMLAEAIGEPEAVAVANSLAGISHHLAGDQELARRELELSLRQSLPSDRLRTIHYGFDHRNRSGIALARTLWLQGYAEQARRVADETVREAAALDHPITHCIALIWKFSVLMWMGDHERAQQTLDTFARCAELNAFEPYIAAASGFRGHLALRMGRPHDACGALEGSLARLHAARYELLTTSFESASAVAASALGRQEQALDLIARAIERCQRIGEGYALPELLRIKARIVQRADSGDHEALLREALTTSRSQGARAWELRAATDLARLLSERGQHERARVLLQPLRASFREGHDTADLHAADLLLEVLTAADSG